MQNRYCITMKVASNLQAVYDTFMQIVDSNKMKVKKEKISKGSFYVLASEKMNWFALNWPTRIEITARQIKENIIFELASSSFMTSLTQNSKNSKTLEYFAQSMKIYLE